MRSQPSRRFRRQHGSPTRRYEIRYRCLAPFDTTCRACRSNRGEPGHHLESHTGDLERARKAVLYLQRVGTRAPYIWDAWTNKRVDFRGYEPGIWKLRILEAWGDPSYEALSALREAQGTWSLMAHERYGYRVLARELPLAFLWPIREALGGLVSEEDPVAFVRWALKQLRAASIEQVALLGSGLCFVADWPGALPVEKLVSPAA